MIASNPVYYWMNANNITWFLRKKESVKVIKRHAIFNPLNIWNV